VASFLGDLKRPPTRTLCAKANAMGGLLDTVGHLEVYAPLLFLIGAWLATEYCWPAPPSRSVEEVALTDTERETPRLSPEALRDGVREVILLLFRRALILGLLWQAAAKLKRLPGAKEQASVTDGVSRGDMRLSEFYDTLANALIENTRPGHVIRTLVHLQPCMCIPYGSALIDTMFLVTKTAADMLKACSPPSGPLQNDRWYQHDRVIDEAKAVWFDDSFTDIPAVWPARVRKNFHCARNR
jgi:hypothetical protein